MQPRRLLPLALCLAACASEGFPDLPEPVYPDPAAVAAGLADLPFPEFLDRSFAALLERSPESLTDLGAQPPGARDRYLDDLSDAFADGTWDLAEAILARLRAFDRAALDPAGRLNRDVYEWYLDDLLRERPFRHHAYLLNGSLTSEHMRLLSLFTQVHPLATRANAEDYVERLWRVRRRVDQAIAGLDARAREGLMPPQAVLGAAIADLELLGGTSAAGSPFYDGLAGRLPAVPLDSADRARLLADAERAVRLSVLPALRDLAAAARRHWALAPTGEGAWTLPDGDAWYRQQLRHHTTLELTPAEIHALGLAEVARLHGALRERFAALGFPAGLDVPAGLRRAAAQGGVVPAGQCLARYAAILAEAQDRLDDAIGLRPKAALEVRADPVGGYYIAGSVDGSRPGVFYAYVPSSGLYAYRMKSLAYHEGVPGHHLQLSIAREQAAAPALRRTLGFTAHAEGWALYAERLAAELGFYEGDDLGDVGRLEYELLRAVRLVVDTELHDRRWTSAQARSWVQANLGGTDEILRYLSWPGQATAYKVGMERILALREALAARLGPAWQARAFHRTLLLAGSVPLPVLERLVAEADWTQ